MKYVKYMRQVCSKIQYHWRKDCHNHKKWQLNYQILIDYHILQLIKKNVFYTNLNTLHLKTIGDQKFKNMQCHSYHAISTTTNNLKNDNLVTT